MALRKGRHIRNVPRRVNAAGSVRCVKLCLGEFRQGMAGKVSQGSTRLGKAGQAGLGTAWHDTVRHGVAGEAWQGEAGHGTARHGRLGTVGQDKARQGSAGLEERRNQHGVPMENPNCAGIGADGRRRV